MTIIKTDVLIQAANVPNKNGRIYPHGVLEGMLDGLKKSEPIHGVVGVDSPDPTFVNPEKISHRVKNLRVTDTGLIGDIEVLDTAMGRELEQLWKENEVEFRIRALVEVKENIVRACAVISIDAVNECA